MTTSLPGPSPPSLTGSGVLCAVTSHPEAVAPARLCRSGPVRPPPPGASRDPPGPPPRPPATAPAEAPPPGHGAMMRFMLLFSCQGKLRLQKWYLAMADKDKKKMLWELMQVVLARKPKMCSFLEWRDLKVVFKR
ncbi:putative serine/threonine-protein kinase-like protein CCR3 [Pipra filicauda]|uniref:Serine/threonine-protein kinase-like protein CCR3 n=1 Tax=Pipra filicauda TaxID=649802 RepID=A0A6J2J299_9PASS|nr:putative serine/threonine-protein kinase-like protein CCR3 [Pipra filicauda]